MSDEERSSAYVLRFQERALRDIDVAFVRLAELSGENIADAWRDGLREAIAGLAQNPRRCPRAPERFRREVCQLVYRRTPGGPAHRILFTITGEEPGSPDAPTVTILHIRHGARRPITGREAGEIEP